jgi:hypothetical protein
VPPGPWTRRRSGASRGIWSGQGPHAERSDAHHRDDRIVDEARVRASANRDAAARSASRRLLTSTREGERIVGLAFVQEVGGNYRLDDVLARIENSASALEMFHALVALREIEPSLEPDQCEVAVQVLEKEKTDYRGVAVMEDPNLPRLIDDVISRLQSFEGG